MDYTDNEKPIIEVFKEFALKTKRQIFYTENLYQETKLLQSAMTKITLYIPDKNGEQIYLIGYHNPKALGNKDLYFGSFFPEFHNKSNFGIFTKSKWITDFEVLEILLKNIGKINSSLNQ